jgi:hypothetical protein
MDSSSRTRAQNVDGITYPTQERQTRLAQRFRSTIVLLGRGSAKASDMVQTAKIHYSSESLDST